MLAKEIAKRNDLLRRSLPCIYPPNLAVLTKGVASLGDEEVNEIFKKVRDFSEFTEGNDPWGEHDFGAFQYNSREFFWKIDDYGGHEGYNLILTIMLAEDY